MLNRYSRSEASEKVSEIIHKAGYDTPTPIQRNIIPLLFQGRDFFVETLEAQGKSLATLIFSLFRVDYSGEQTKTLIVTTNPQEVTKIQRQFEFLPAELQQGIRFAPLGFENDPKKELKFLHTTPHIIIGTTERIIDHLRRDNINLPDLELLLILDDRKEETGGFLQDILFITSKAENLQQRIVLSAAANDGSSLIEQLHRPQIIRFFEWASGDTRHLSYTLGDGKDKSEIIETLYHEEKLKESVLITKNTAQACALEKRLSLHGIPSRHFADIGKNQGSGNAAVPLIATYKNIDAAAELAPSSFVFYQFPGDYHLYARTMKKISGHKDRTTFISILHDRDQKSFNFFKEEYKLEIKEENVPEEKDAELKGHIAKIIKIIKEEENPHILDYYKGVIKRNVPVFLRSYFTGYLLKEAIGEEPISRRSSSSSSRTAQFSGTYTTLFVSVGKNRKVYPKDLVKLFAQAVGIEQSAVGQIKILDSYSFVDIPEASAQKAIDMLNGEEFRGRKITVNFAKKKEDKNN